MNGYHILRATIISFSLLFITIYSHNSSATGSSNPSKASTPSVLVPCEYDKKEQCIQVTLKCTNVGWFNQKCGPGAETIQIPHGRPIYALLVSGFHQNRNLNMFHFYNFSRCLHEKGAYVHYAWWNNLLAPYMERPLHNPDSVPSTQSNPRHDIEGQYNWFTWMFYRRYPTKAIPAEDHQFQQDATTLLTEIRRHNPKAAIILVGHSMGGDAVVRLADNMPDNFIINLLAPIDPVGNRTCMSTSPNNTAAHCSGDNHFKRFYTVREDYFMLPKKRTLGSNIKYLYHRWQGEWFPPWDYLINEYFYYPNTKLATNINSDSTNVQAKISTHLRSGEDVPPSLGGPNYNGGLEGHGEVVGFRGTRLSLTEKEWLAILAESWPLALDAQNWPRGGECVADKTDAECRIYHLRNWETNPKYLDDNHLAPPSPTTYEKEYCRSRKLTGDDCTYCMVSGDLCKILKQKLVLQ